MESSSNIYSTLCYSFAEVFVRIFQTRSFAKFARKEGIHAERLLAAVSRLEAGGFDAHLGFGLYKQRVAREGSGRSVGFRTILIFRSQDRAIFVHGFAKSDKANISEQDLQDLRLLAKRVLRYTSAEMAKAVRNGDFVEVEE